jgi:hypothetical protein
VKTLFYSGDWRRVTRGGAFCAFWPGKPPVVTQAASMSAVPARFGPHMATLSRPDSRHQGLDAEDVERSPDLRVGGHRLDRLARSTRDLLNTLAKVTGKGAGFRSLKDTWADTTTAHGRLMVTILGGLAEFEGELIRARTGEGRERAKARGVKMGRRPKLTDHQKREAIKRRDRDGETLAEIGRSYNVSGWTIARLV